MRYPKVTFGKHFPDSRLYDWMVYDQITGFKVWHSEVVKLDKYTGKGGLLTHYSVANKALNIDYGLVPYKIPAELPIKEATSNHQVNPDIYSPNTTFEEQETLAAQENINIIASDGSYILVG